MKHAVNIIKNLYVFSAAVENDYIYLVSPYYYMAFILDRKTYRIVDFINLGKNEQQWSVSEIMAMDDSIYTMPYMDSVINKILKTSKYVRKISIEKTDKRVWYSGCIVGRHIWVMPAMESDQMYSINIDSLQVEIYPSVFKDMDVPERLRREYGHPVFTSLKAAGEKIWFAARQGQYIFCYDTAGGKWKKFKVPFGITDLTFAEGRFWILSTAKVIYGWNADEGISVEYKIKTEKICKSEKEAIPFIYITYKNKKLWCLPDFSDSIVALDINTMEEKCIPIIEGYKNERVCIACAWYRDFLYIFSQELDQMWEVDSVTYNVKTFKLNIPEDIRDELLREKSVWDEMQAPLNKFILNCKKEDETQKGLEIGKAIYGRLIQRV